MVGFEFFPCSALLFYLHKIEVLSAALQNDDGFACNFAARFLRYACKILFSVAVK
jgi:hypothetical protein